MNKGINVVSTFDGMGCLYITLKELGIKVNKYFAVEIDKHAIAQTKLNFPDIIHLGDITKVTKDDFQGLHIHLFAGGSPCQGFSFAGKQLAFNDPRSVLFFEFVRLRNELNPDYFLLENVRMKKEWELVISRLMGVAPIEINSNLVSAQNRLRYYWTNINNKPYGLFGDMFCDIPQPKDRGLLLRDILEDEVDDKYYLSEKVISKLIEHKERHKEKGNGFGVIFHKEENKMQSLTVGGKGVNDLVCVAQRGRNLQSGVEQVFEPRYDGKTNCITSVQKDNLVNDRAKIRRLTPTECARLQTIPNWYKWNCSDTQKYKMLGNGWTIEIIKHILSYMPTSGS
jgi:site-specific DNA-cytosine methylase